MPSLRYDIPPFTIDICIQSPSVILSRRPLLHGFLNSLASCLAPFRLQELATGPPPPFTLTETRGDTLMTLSRQFGSETINVDVMVNDQPEEEPFESEEGVLDVDVGVVFTAEVVKGDQSFVFECKSDGSYLSILHVAIEPANEDVEDSAYTGPVYDELDEEVQRQFQVFLEERGVNAELGGYLLRLVHDKEQREYMDWLEKAAALVKA